MTETASQKPLYANQMLLNSEHLRGLNTANEFRMESERQRRFTNIAAARAGLSSKDPMLQAMLHSSRAEDSEISPDSFKLETFEVDRVSQSDGFGSVVEPFSPEEFFTRQYQQRTHMLFRGPSDRFSHLIGWNDLTVLIRSANFQPKQLNVVISNQTINDADYIRSFQSAGGQSDPRKLKPRVFDENRLNYLLRNGASLLINSIGDVHSGINRFISSISNSLGTFTSGNLYASWRDVKAFPTHWDDHDVYILQLHGSKIWNLYGELRESPLPKDVEPNVKVPSKPQWSGRLESGDVLFIPRGGWHDAVVPEDFVGQGSMHLTLSFKEFYSSDVINWLTYKIIKDWDRARINVPRNAEPGLADEYFRELRDAVVEVLDHEPVREFDDYLRARWREETNLQIGAWIEPWNDPQWHRYRLKLRGFHQARVESNAQASTFTLTANRRSTVFDLRCLDVIQHLLDNESVSVSDLRAFDLERFNEKFMDEMIIHLVRQDIVVAELPESR